jgi:hypothetical protein
MITISHFAAGKEYYMRREIRRNERRVQEKKKTGERTNEKETDRGGIIVRYNEETRGGASARHKETRGKNAQVDTPGSDAAFSVDGRREDKGLKWRENERCS